MIEISVSPVAFRWGPLTIGWYDIMVELAVITIILWRWRAVKWGLGLTSDTVITAAIVGIPAGVIFSRLRD